MIATLKVFYVLGLTFYALKMVLGKLSETES